jgi:prefoldin subunit 4
MSAFATTKDPESETEVRLQDQEKINEFGKLNNRLMEITAEMKQSKTDLELLQDASGDLEMLIDGNASLLIGEAFIEVNEDYANEYLSKKIKIIEDRMSSFESETKTINTSQAELKKDLYARFGDAIQLEA